MAVTTTKLNIIKDMNGTISYSLTPSNTIYNGVLAANVEQSVVAPNDATRFMVVVGISNGSDVFVSSNGVAATVPVGALAASSSMLNIAQTYVDGGESVSVISPQDDVLISLSFYAMS